MTDTVRTVRRDGILYAIDLVTGYTRPLPAGGSSSSAPPATGDASTSTDSGTGTDGSADDAGTDDGAGEGTSSGDDGAGGKDAVLADLARERDRRQALEAELQAERAKHETDQERLARETREAALSPARGMARRHAVELAARDAGFVDPADAVGNLTLSGALEQIDVDETTLAADRRQALDAVAKLAKDKPHLLTSEAREALEGKGGTTTGGGGDPRGGAGGSTGSGGTGRTPQESMTTMLRGALNRR